MREKTYEDDEHAIKNDSHPTQTGDRWADHLERRFTTVVKGEWVFLDHDDGDDEGPFHIEEFEDSREYLNYLGRLPPTMRDKVEENLYSDSEFFDENDIPLPDDAPETSASEMDDDLYPE